jgi:hypothetical protein
MKVKTQFGVRGYTGAVDGMVYYMLPNCDVVIGRKKPEKIKLKQQHLDYRVIYQNLRIMGQSQGFKDDFKLYTALYKELPVAKKSVSGWYNLFITLMWDLHKAGTIDLKTITREQIYAENLPCKSVKAAVDAGLLALVLNYHNLDTGI